MERIQLVRLVAMMVCAVSISGCGSSTMGPKLPRELTAPSLVIYSQADFNTDSDHYRKAIQDKDLDAAKALRNRIAYRVMADIESGYGKFEMNMTTQRAAFETGSDAIQLGITAATTVVGGGDVKDLLAASLSAFQGTRLSYDKNWYREKTTEALLSQMRASRKTKQAQLILSLETRDVDGYPLEAAWIDLVDFYYAGTVPSALVEIAGTAGAGAEVAKVKLSDAVAALTPCTPSQANQFVGIRTAYTKLASAINGSDATRQASAMHSLRSLLTAAGRTPDVSATGAEMLAQFRQAIVEANCGDTLKTLQTAVAGVPIE